MKAEVFRGPSKHWHVRIVGGNGETMFVSESYFSKWNAKRAAAKTGLPVTVIDAVQE